MRKVFLFWGIIFVLLIAGTVAIVHGKILLKKEIELAERIKKEIPVPKMRSKVASTGIVTPLEAEAYKAPEDVELPETAKVTVMQAGPIPHIHRSPIMPRLYKPLEDLND